MIDSIHPPLPNREPQPEKPLPEASKAPVAASSLPTAGAPTAASADLLRRGRPLVHLASLSLVALVAAFVGWSAWAHVDEVTRGSGRVIPASRVQVVQSLEGGIVRGINVREGGLVKQGDVLIQIDPTGFGSSLGERREKLLGILATLSRLQAEAQAIPLSFPVEVLRDRPDLVAAQTELFTQRRQEREAAFSALDLLARQRQQEIVETQSKIETLEKAIRLAVEERDLTRPLVERGAAARIELIRLDSRVNELQGALDGARLAMPRIESALAEARDRRREKEAAARGEMSIALTEARIQSQSLLQSMRADEDRISRTEIRAPVNGVIKTVNLTTLGQVVKPGSDIMEIVPLDESLLVEAEVRPQDIAFLRPGMAANVRISAYDYTIYGALPAEVERISADAISKERGEAVYLVRVRTRRAYLEFNGRQLPIMPGMMAEVDVLTGRKSVMTYLTTPLTRMRSEALRER